MEPRLSFKYDREADILYIDRVRPYPEQGTEELGDDVIARLNPTTGEIETLEVLFFSTRPCARSSLSCRWWPTYACPRDEMNTIPPTDHERPSQDDTIEAWRRRIGRLDPRQIAAWRAMTPAQRLDLARHPADAGGSQPGEGT